MLIWVLRLVSHRLALAKGSTRSVSFPRLALAIRVPHGPLVLHSWLYFQEVFISSEPVELQEFERKYFFQKIDSSIPADI